MKKFLVLLSFLFVGSLANAKDAAQSKNASAKSGVEVTLTKDNTITLNDAFYGDTVAKLTKRAKELDSRTESADPIYLVLNSPGGSIDAGLELIENLNSLRRPVKTISIFSASMGFQTVQGVKGERLVVSDGTLMSHKARGGFYGEFPGQLDSRYAYYLKRITRMDEKAVSRTNGKLTLQSYRNLIENEYWCDGQECVDQGFADRVTNAQCDKSLEGTRKEVWYRDIFMGMVIEIIATMDNCPLNTYALSYNYYIDGQPLFPERDENGKTEEQKKKEAKEAAAMLSKPEDKSSTGGYYSSVYGGYGYSSSYDDEDKKKISSEMLLEIRNKLDRVVNDRKERKVIKGY